MQMQKKCHDCVLLAGRAVLIHRANSQAPMSFCCNNNMSTCVLSGLQLLINCTFLYQLEYHILAQVPAQTNNSIIMFAM